MAAPTSQRLRASVMLSLGDTDGDIPPCLNFAELTTATANSWLRLPLDLAASAVNQSLNLATYFTSVSWIAVVDKGGTGLLVGTASGTSGRCNVAASKMLLFCNGDATPPTIYIDNVSGTDAAFVEVYAFGTQS